LWEDHLQLIEARATHRVCATSAFPAYLVCGTVTLSQAGRWVYRTAGKAGEVELQGEQVGQQVEQEELLVKGQLLECPWLETFGQAWGVLELMTQEPRAMETAAGN